MTAPPEGLNRHGRRALNRHRGFGLTCRWICTAQSKRSRRTEQRSSAHPAAPGLAEPPQFFPATRGPWGATEPFAVPEGRLPSVITSRLKIYEHILELCRCRWRRQLGFRNNNPLSWYRLNTNGKSFPAYSASVSAGPVSQRSRYRISVENLSVSKPAQLFGLNCSICQQAQWLQRSMRISTYPSPLDPRSCRHQYITIHLIAMLYVPPGLVLPPEPQATARKSLS
jgi:hypothetical protein